MGWRPTADGFAEREAAKAMVNGGRHAGDNPQAKITLEAERCATHPRGVC